MGETHFQKYDDHKKIYYEEVESTFAQIAVLKITLFIDSCTIIIYHSILGSSNFR